MEQTHTHTFPSSLRHTLQSLMSWNTTVFDVMVTAGHTCSQLFLLTLTGTGNNKTRSLISDTTEEIFLILPFPYLYYFCSIFTVWDECIWEKRRPRAELFVIILSSKGRSVQRVVVGKSNSAVTLLLIKDQSLGSNCFPSLFSWLDSLSPYPFFAISF